jgi:hypothetical protein
MMAWWNSLSNLNQVFYCAAVFVSIPFAWQFAAAFLGLAAGSNGAVDGGGDYAASGHEAPSDQAFDQGAQGDSAATVLAFKMLSLQSLTTFFTLFCWGGALYLNRGVPVARAMGVSALWGLAGMVCVSILLYALPRLAQTGTRDLNSCIGTEAVVYLDIPAQKAGQIRATVSGTVCYIRARSAAGTALKAGTPVRVTRRVDLNTVAVEPVLKV